ncbi:hypothetical protein BaRGS_00034039 [Batillaria attramentaria]|uniref:Uncharacterized protein n=1 Tax=Batillaria attramentaria TaxID=370345 RepID=A0ABD0JII9_9CAEN
MEVRLLLFCVVAALLQTTVSATAELLKNCLPPSVQTERKGGRGDRTIFFQEEGTVSLGCFATGNETLKYTWLKDGEVLDLISGENSQRMSLSSGVGTLVISSAMEPDAGVYQCKVENPCGISLSAKTLLKHAYIDPFPKLDKPQKEIAMLGRGQKLSCTSPDSVPSAKIQWIKEGDDEPYVNVEVGERITMDYSGNLYFVYIKKEDARKYICEAKNMEVRLTSQGDDKEIETYGDALDNTPASLMWNSDENVMVLEGSTAKFKCIFSGYPAPDVRWRRADNGVYDTSRMVIGPFKHELVIKDVQPEDAGQYECSAANPMLSERVKVLFTLTVQSRPRWTKVPTDRKVGVEEDVTLVCEADANPNPEIQWYRNGIPIEKTPEAKNRKLQGNALVFTNLSQSDSQVLQCNASNIHGYLWADIYLQVVAEAPSIQTEPGDKKVAEETDVTIPCKVEGKPKPTVKWYKGDQLLDGNRYEILPSGDLVVKSARKKDGGLYSCRAKNRFGDAEASGNLVVRKKTQIVSEPMSARISYGDEAVFRCGAETDHLEEHKLTYKWLKDGKEVDKSDSRVTVDGGELTIIDTNSQDTGDYTCVANNTLDADSKTATLEVKAPPDPPYNVKVMACGERGDIEWQYEDSLSNFSPLQGFVVEYNNSHESKWIEGVKPEATARQASIKLLPWAYYYFRVRAVNALGTGNPSEPTDTICRTEEKKPFRNPANVRTVGDKTGYLVIEWDKMEKVEHNGPDFRYVITWRAEDDTTVESYEESNWETVRKEVKVDDIYKPYVVTVAAKNSKGTPLMQPKEVKGFSGEAKPEVMVEDFGLDPDVPITSTSAGFRWSPVDTSPEKIKGEFQGYKIRYWKEDQFNTTLHEELIVVPQGRRRRASDDDGMIRGKVSNLPSFSKIEADVVVVNTYFSSEGSNVVNFSTPEGVPGRVSYFEALFRGSSHFLLEWGPPVEENGEITGYEIGYRKIQGFRVDQVVTARNDIPPNQFRTTIDGLDDNSLYRVYVWARTKEGRGREYFIDVKTTNKIEPITVPEIEQVVPTDETANVTWNVNGEKGVRTGAVCYLEYREMGSKLWERRSEGAKEHFWLTLDKLEPATEYEVRIICLPGKASSGSEGIPSTKKTFHTTGVRAARGNILSAGWFIGMMVAIAILLLILIIVCIVKRNRGKEYKFPPEKDTVDEPPGHFNEMAKSDKNGVGASASFERDPEKVPLEEETDSLEDYGDVDPTKFNEDGSFIGQYGSGEKPGEPPNASAMSSIV